MIKSLLGILSVVNERGERRHREGWRGEVVYNTILSCVFDQTTQLRRQGSALSAQAFHLHPGRAFAGLSVVGQPPNSGQYEVRPHRLVPKHQSWLRSHLLERYIHPSILSQYLHPVSTAIGDKAEQHDLDVIKNSLYTGQTAWKVLIGVGVGVGTVSSSSFSSFHSFSFFFFSLFHFLSLPFFHSFSLPLYSM